jgi:osmotically-inducible protein OsmY
MRASGLLGVGWVVGVMLSGCIAAVVGNGPYGGASVGGNVNHSQAASAADRALEAAVRERFDADALLHSLGLAIRARDGTVTLMGTVVTAGQGDRAIRAARTVAGVVAVNNQLRVN